MTDSQPVESHPGLTSVRKRAAIGAWWTLAGYGAQQVLRFGNNLVLTRLLAPEVFGLMALASVFLLGLEMLSDVGISQSIIQSKRGEEPSFLDTAWTIQIVRGIALAAIATALAWPASRIYAQPQLVPLIIVMGVGMVVRGFTPTRFHALSRRVVLGRITVMELSSQVLSITVTIAAAWATRSVWALVIGSLSGDAARVSLCYVLLPGNRHRLSIDQNAVADIVRVGRWTILGAAMTYAASNLDRLALARLLSVRELGIYSIALMIPTAIVSLGRALGNRVLFPLLAETARSAPGLLYSRLRKARIISTVPAILVLLALSIAGDTLVALLYSREFHEAGWMLRILAAGAIFAVLNQTTGIVWPSLGEFQITMLLAAIQVPVLCGALLIGYWLNGVVGFVIGCAAVEAIVFPIQAILAARRHVWQAEVDVPIIGVSSAIVALGVLLR